MRARGLSFADAVALLGGDSPGVGRLGRLAGLGAGAVTVASLGTVDFFALRGEAVRWGNSAVRGWREKVRGLGRYDRTDRLVAAHTVIVVVAFFEALDEILAERGIDLAEARLTAAEQAALATGTPAALAYDEMIDVLIRRPAPFPTPRTPFGALDVKLSDHYVRLTYRTSRFLGGLSGFETVEQRTIDRALLDRSLRRYTESYLALAAEIPEFRLWTDMVDGQATRELVRQASDALQQSLHADVDAVRAGLVRRYQAQLDKPILSSADAADDLVLPTLREGYLEPSGLVAAAGPDSLPATERWWRSFGRPLPNVPDFVLASMTGPAATEGPMVILGQPGSGKSVLTRTLAARLATADFLPVRVELRNVRADSPVQTQIEEALHLLLGEKVSWPDLVRRAGTALPVVMMDGFDELLQATGQNWADYLEQLRDFQQREAELGRPLAVLVTSRTVVADRARFPHDTTVVRLNPFDDAQVGAWLGVWNSLNATNFAARGLRPLSAEAVLAHRELVDQPLLLLLLALYDGRANQLQKHADGLGRVELYERLLADFFERQVDKFGSRMSDDQRAAEVAAEWRRLCAVAVAMLNRGRDVILEPELEADLRHLLGAEDWSPGPGGRQSLPLTAGQLLVGRFFFIHESRASRDTGPAERSFEFLHATFGEFLAARQIVTALTELAEDRTLLRRRPGATIDAGFFFALTSYATLTRREPLWDFTQGMLARLDPAVRRRCRDLVVELLPEAGYPHPSWTLAGYEPERRTTAAREAAFSANLVCLAVLLGDGPVDVAALTGEPVVINWRRQALLWLSQLVPEDARRLWLSLRVEWDLRTDPTRLLIRVEDGADIGILTSLPWRPEERPAATPAGPPPEDVRVPGESSTGHLLRKSAFMQTGIDTREVLYAMAPFWRRFGDMTFYKPGTKWDSDARDLLEVFLGELSGAGPEEQARVYRHLVVDAAPPVREVIVEYLSRGGNEDLLARILDLVAPNRARVNRDRKTTVRIRDTAMPAPAQEDQLLRFLALHAPANDERPG